MKSTPSVLANYINMLWINYYTGCFIKKCLTLRAIVSSEKFIFLCGLKENDIIMEKENEHVSER